MTRFRDADVWKLAKKQQGVVAHWQVARLGVKRSTLSARLESGEWIRELHTVSRMAWADSTWLQRAWTGWLWAGPVSVISHLAAASMHGLPVEKPKVIEVTLPARFMPASPVRWLRVHRSRSLKPTDMAKMDGLRVTSPCRTLLDLAAVLHANALERLVQQAVSTGLVTTSALEPFLKRGRGRHGIGNFRRAIALANSGADREMRLS